jgi:mannitol-specific phosphotransferase system IIBC component
MHRGKDTSTGLRFVRFYTTGLAVVVFWLTLVGGLVSIATMTELPRGMFFMHLITVCVVVLVVRVLCESAAVLFQVHDRLDELCQFQREVKEQARKEADAARIAANKARTTPVVG